MTTIALPGEGQGSRYRILGWGASALLHGGALAFFLYGLPHSTMPPPAPEIIPLEMAAAPSAPQMEASEATPAMEEAQAVAPQATTAAQVPPPPLAMTAPEAATPVEPPPDTMAATPPEAVEPPPVEAAPTPPMETLQAVEPEPQRPPEPDVVPLEAADIPPPPPAPPVNYISMVSAALNRAKRYPQRARLRRIEGTAMLSFTMRRDGSVVNWRIVRSAGDPDLDEAVGEMIERASLPPLPDSIPGEIWAPTVAISFSIR
ncbi:TonB family protein [Roseomonas sp. ACRSG]|nr:TonB family protein [Roseomonas sp. ACRSG]